MDSIHREADHGGRCEAFGRFGNAHINMYRQRHCDDKKADAQMIEFEDFQRIDMATGTIVEARLNDKARAPAYVLRIDFGPAGEKTSSAQLTANYSPEDLVGKQIVAVMNFPPKRVAGVKSEVLVLGAVSDEHGIVLLEPSFPVADGTAIG
ncbi:MAG: tRNA-binding protein [Halofilum sp. (in: g-proteobacteria)]